ncbi:MAG: TlyA family RNA methyltransferase [Deltaproteobacteria bacterium]|nr:TlyA family RNA methyltransferase [Deltaproteobacteria bacterium]
MKKPQKVRIDTLVLAKGLASSRQKAQALIMTGNVLVEGRVVDKAGKEVAPDSVITIKETLPFVSRGGLKLAGFLDERKLDVAGLAVMDVGSSTGGFTDCLLKRGAKKVYAVDVGKGILDVSLRNDPRVVVLEERNIRHMDTTDVGELVDLAVIDVSFISLEKVLPKVKEFLKEGGRVLALIKPQFEVGKGQVGKGGIVKDPEKHRAVVERIREFSVENGYSVVGAGESPITGAKGNREFWIDLLA